MTYINSGDLQLLRRHVFSVLLEGPAAATDAVLRLLQLELAASHQAGAPLVLPGDEAHTLVVKDPSALTGEAQRGLLAWLGDANPARRIISTTARPLFPFVTDGRFDATLYYRMNVLLLRVGTDLSAVPIALVGPSTTSTLAD
jgi:hypothetical protein